MAWRRTTGAKGEVRLGTVYAAHAASHGLVLVLPAVLVALRAEFDASFTTLGTVATVSGEAFYYISQRTERAAQFLPDKVADQRVIAVYFDRSRRVERLAHYGLQDGRVFDYVSRTTTAGGQDYNYLTYLFKIIGKS